MLRFKDFKQFKKTKEGHIILDEPIHFKNEMASFRKTKEGHIILDEPLGQKSKLKESEEHTDETHAAAEYNKKHHGSNSDLSDKLHKATASHMSDEDKGHIHAFTGQDHRDPERNGSYYLNKKLVRGEEPTGHFKHMHDTIMKHAKAAGHEHHVFSGTSRDLGSLARHSKDGIIHTAAHTSATHALHIARQFADNKFADSHHNETRHMVHIHVKPHDKVLHTSKHSEYAAEHETVIPAGTKLKYSHSSDHHNDGDHYRVHHFTIHSQK